MSIFGMRLCGDIEEEVFQIMPSLVNMILYFSMLKVKAIHTTSNMSLIQRRVKNWCLAAAGLA